MAICTAINFNSLNADIGRAHAAIPPPFRGTKQADYGSAGGDGQMRGASIPTNINLGTPG